MVRRAMALLWAALVLFGVGGGARASEHCPTGELTIGTDATFPPFSSKVGEDFVGMEIELGEDLARRLGCRVRWVNSSFDGIFPALLAGKYDLVVASVTITDERRKSMVFSDPYMDAGQSIAAPRSAPSWEGLEALKGRKVGVGLNTTGQFLVEKVPEIALTKYPSVDLAMADLQNGRLDAVVGDGPVLRYMIRETFTQLKMTGKALNSEQWGFVFAPGREALLAAFNAQLAAARADGTYARLEQEFLGEKAAPPPSGGGEPSAAAPSASPPPTLEAPGFRPDRFMESIPLFLKGAEWTLALSLMSFVAAVPLGLLIALMRIARAAPVRVAASVYVEVLRGTPLLVQIFFIYFVLPAFGITLGEVTTAVMALSVNASAYVAEIFRAGLQSIDVGQSEAGSALGLTRAQVFRHVLIPQAVRRVVPPLTNEAIALIKDSSLVSIMGMTELTRTGQELASRYADPLTIWPGVALTYFVLTFPLTRLSARLERTLHEGQRRTGGAV